MIHLICFTPDKYLFKLPGQRPQSPNRWPKAPLVHPPHGGQEGSFRLQPRTPHALPRSLRCSPCVQSRSLSPHLCLPPGLCTVGPGALLLLAAPFAAQKPPQRGLHTPLLAHAEPLTGRRTSPAGHSPYAVTSRLPGTVCQCSCITLPNAFYSVCYGMCNTAHSTLCIIRTTRTNHGNRRLCRSGVGKLWPRGHTWPTACFSYRLQTWNGLHIFQCKMLKKKERICPFAKGSHTQCCVCDIQACKA